MPDDERRRREDDAALAGRLKDLSERLDARSGTELKAPVEEPTGAYGLVTRLISDLVAGTLVGAVMGWGLDRLFHTAPVFLAVFIILGFAAGVWMMIRSSRG